MRFVALSDALRPSPRKDLRSELRTKEALNASLAFSLVILVLFSFAFDPGNSEVTFTRSRAACCGWCSPSPARWSLNRSFARELQNDCLDALIASPAPTGAVSRARRWRILRC